MPLSEACPEEVFFGAVRAAQTRWLVDNLRMALDYAERDADTWSKSFSEEFMRYLQEQTAKPKVGKAFVQKTQKEKLLAYAKSLKDKLPAALFQAKGFELTDSSANFIFMKHPEVDGAKIYEEMKRRGVLIRHFTKPRMAQYNRVTIGSREQMDIFLKVLGEVIEELK